MRDVFKNLIDGLNEAWIKIGKYWRILCKSAITQARHWAVRSLIFQAASNASISPLRLSFTGTLRVVRRALPKFQGLQPQEFPFF